MNRTGTACAAILMCLAFGGEVAHAAARTPLDFNISVNSGAEGGRGGRGQVVPIPLWRTTSTMTAVRYGTPGFPSRAEAIASHGEKNFFYCGQDTAKSVARQRIAILRRDRLIDRGSLALRLTVRIGSNSTDGDAGRMIVRYLDRAGRTLGKLRTASVEATGGSMPRIKASGRVPAGTRALQVALMGTGTAGTSCDVFFDNVSVKLARGTS
jgi:propanediol dehydratase large subunit